MLGSSGSSVSRVGTSKATVAPEAQPELAAAPALPAFQPDRRMRGSHDTRSPLTCTTSLAHTPGRQRSGIGEERFA